MCSRCIDDLRHGEQLCAKTIIEMPAHPNVEYCTETMAIASHESMHPRAARHLPRILARLSVVITRIRKDGGVHGLPTISGGDGGS